MRKQKIIVVLGPTATGKSNLAVFLAKKFGGEVVSADSRQVYRGLNIGTGKITGREMRGIPHHLLNIADPRGQFSAAQYKELALRAIADIAARGKIPILCGGTGFYMDTVVGEIVLPEVKPDEKLRKKLDGKTTEELYAMLKKLDPRRAGEIDRNNPRRLVRAIEIANAIGRVPRYKLQDTGYKVLKIGLTVPDEELRRKIHIRLFVRMGRGMVAEAKRLHARGLSWKRMNELGLEYRYLAKYLSNKMTKEEMLAKLETEIWRYAKRQMTWFKRDKGIKWFNPTEFKKIEKETEKFLKTRHAR